MTWYCSWYFPLKSKLFLSKKLWWRFYLAISSLSLRPVQIIQNASHQSIRQLNSPTKRFQNVGSICPNNTFRYIYMSSVDHTISVTCSYYNILNFFDQGVIQKIRSSYRILYGKLFGGWRCSKCQWMISNFFFNFSGVFLWSTMWFIDFVYSKP